MVLVDPSYKCRAFGARNDILRESSVMESKEKKSFARVTAPLIAPQTWSEMSSPHKKTLQTHKLHCHETHRCLAQAPRDLLLYGLFETPKCLVSGPVSVFCLGEWHL